MKNNCEIDNSVIEERCDKIEKLLYFLIFHGVDKDLVDNDEEILKEMKKRGYY